MAKIIVLQYDSSGDILPFLIKETMPADIWETEEKNKNAPVHKMQQNTSKIFTRPGP